MLAARTTPTTAPSRPTGVEDVRNLLDRYAAAWRRRDVDELRRIGQVKSDKQAAALDEYFASVKDFDVQVKILDVVPEGEGWTVRFTRRDSFRDPTGELVSKESPTIEKQVVRTPDGLRFAPGP
jgi:hypothetical protein